MVVGALAMSEDSYECKGWPALVGWRFLCVCAFDGFLLWVRIASACPTIASLCNSLSAGVYHVCVTKRRDR